MPIPTTELGKRLMRWQLAHTAPAPLSIDHPVQVDLAAAADEIERFASLKMPNIAKSGLTKSTAGKLRDLADEMRRFASNMRRDDADARSSELSLYAEAMDEFADRIAKLTAL